MHTQAVPTTYAQDDLYRLNQVTYTDGEQVSYAYDPMGNRTAMTSTTSGATTYTYDAGDRLLEAAGPSGTTAFTWDANGNMTGKGSAAYTFDTLNRLTQVVSGTTTVHFTYDGDGVRLGKTVNGTATAYIQDIAAPLPVVLTETTAGQTNQYVYGNDLLAREDAAGNPSFYHYDGLGSTRTLSDLAGERTDSYSYNVFGATRVHTGTNINSFTFTGEEMDPETGLVLLRARYHDPDVGRFISRDPFQGLDTDIQQKNRYVYVANNPVNLVDPTGLAYTYTKVRLGIFKFGGVSLEAGLFTDIDTGETRFVIIPGGGVGFGGSLGLEAGYSTSELPDAGVDIRTRAGLKVLGFGGDLGTKYDPNSGTSCIQGSFSSAKGVLCGDRESNLNTRVGGSPVPSVDAEASATLNYRFVLTLTKPRRSVDRSSSVRRTTFGDLLRETPPRPPVTFGDLLRDAGPNSAQPIQQPSSTK